MTKKPYDEQPHCDACDAAEGEAHRPGCVAAITSAEPLSGPMTAFRMGKTRFAVSTVWRGNEGQQLFTDIIEAANHHEAVGLAFEKRFAGNPLAMAAAVDVNAAQEPVAQGAEG